MEAIDLEEGEIAGESSCLPENALEEEVHDRCEGPAQPAQAAPEEAAQPRKKRRLQKLAAAAVSAVGGFFDVYGADARADVRLNYTHAIRMPDVQALLLWVLGEGANPQWAFVQNKPLISKVAVVAVPGLSEDLFGSMTALMPNLAALPRPVVLMAKNAMVRPVATVGMLFSVPHTRKRKRYLEALDAGLDAEGKGEDDSAEARAERLKKQRQQQRQQVKDGVRPFPPTHYVASVAEMESAEFPLPGLSPDGQPALPEGYVSTLPGPVKGSEEEEEEEEEPLLVGLDCEMCVTEAGFELTRISLVDDAGKVLLDELVVPDNPITDYNTRFSGITEEMLAPVTTRLPDIQKRFLQLVPAETLLVGHALQNDLVALKICHANVIDTAFLFPHPKGPPYRSALRKLAEKFLHRQIQAGSHDSVDDARAAMELALLKIKHGPSYGLAVVPEQEGDALCEVLSAAGRRCSLVDRPDVLGRHVTGNASAFVCQDDEACTVAAAKEGANKATNFTWVQLRDLGSFLEQRSWHRRALTKAAAAAGMAIDHGVSAYSKAQQQEPQQREAAPNGRSTGGEEGADGTSAATALTDDEEGELGPEAACAAIGTPAAAKQPEQQQQQNGHAKEPRSHPITLPPDEDDGAAGASAETAAAPAPCAAHPNGGAGAAGGKQPEEQQAAEEPDEAALAAALAQEREVAAADDARLGKVLRTLDDQIGRLWAALPVNALLMVVAGQGDTPEARRMQEQKWRRQQGLDSLPPWSPDGEARLADAMTKALHGLCFCAVKR